MPKPLFTRLAAICAVGLFCVLFGCVYALSQKDTILLVMSLLLGVLSGKNRPSLGISRCCSVPRTEKNTVSAWKNTPGFWLATATGSILKKKTVWKKKLGICYILRR